LGDKAVQILAKAMYEVVEEDADRRQSLGRALLGELEEGDLRPHFDSMTPDEKSACSDRAEDLAEEHVQQPPVAKPPQVSGMNWADVLKKA